MSSNEYPNIRELQRDARAWADFTGTKYTAALRQVKSPLAQGLFGERVSARQLIATLTDHALIGTRGGDPVLGENGFGSEAIWNFNGETDFIELALIVDMLRMFTPIADTATPEVSSYSLKHTAERFLKPHCAYVSNGRLIWAAAALAIRIVSPESAGPNLMIGVPEREYDYVRRMVDRGQTQPIADHYRPVGHAHLQTALAQVAAGELITEHWTPPTPVDEPSPFHDWLMLQASRDDVVGDLASDYSGGVRSSHHGIAHTPGQLLAILYEASRAPEAHDAAVSAIAEWMRDSPASVPVRTEQISGDENQHEGWGAGAGTTERYEYRCPCGDGRIVEEHDNIPGFRAHDVWIECDKCREEWRFVDGKPTRDWGLVPVAVGATN